jgi:hypothetical protein
MTRSARTGLTTIAFTVALGAATLILLARTLWPAAGVFSGGLLSETVLLWVSALGKVPFLFLGALYAWRNTRRFEPGNPARLGWVLLSWGLLSFLLAQSVLCFYELFRGDAVPFPSVGDVFFLLGYPLLTAALFAFLRSYAAAGFPVGGAGERWALAAGTIVACALIGIPVLRPIVATPAPGLEKFLNLAYPILDFILLVPTVLLLRIAFRFRGGVVWKTWIALLGGFLFNFGGDALFAYLQALGETRFHYLVDILYILAFGLIARGVLYQHELLSD